MIFLILAYYEHLGLLSQVSLQLKVEENGQVGIRLNACSINSNTVLFLLGETIERSSVLDALVVDQVSDSDRGLGDNRSGTISLLRDQVT